MDDKLKKVARTGYAAKGTVYAITGVLTFLAAFNLGGQKASKLQVLEFLDKQPFGNALLVLMGIGLACYAFWRFTQSISDPEGIGNDKKGKGKRVAAFVSACIYLGLAVLAILRVVNSGSSGSTGGSGSPQQSHFLATETGLIILGIIGAAFVAAAIAQFIKAYKGKFLDHFDLKSLSEEKRRKTIKKSGYFGITARGVVFLIIGYFAIQAALSSNPSEIKTTAEVFSFLQDSGSGPWLLGLVAAGFICYAVYMFMVAKYRVFRG